MTILRKLGLMPYEHRNVPSYVYRSGSNVRPSTSKLVSKLYLFEKLKTFKNLFPKMNNIPKFFLQKFTGKRRKRTRSLRATTFLFRLSPFLTGGKSKRFQKKL